MAYHGALAALPVPLKARAGLHVGPVILRANPPEDVAHGAKPLEVEGIAKPIAARVMSLALGGQTLLTAEAREALGSYRLRVQSHGHWRIKGIADPVELFETGDDGAPFMPPPDSAKVYRVVRRGDLWLPMREVRAQPAGRARRLRRPAGRAGRAGAALRRWGAAGFGARHRRHRQDAAGSRASPGLGWVTSPAAPGSATCRRRATSTASCMPWRRDWTCRWALGDPVVQLGHAIAGRGALPGDPGQLRADHPTRRGHARALARPRRRGALPGDHARGAGPARRGGAGAGAARPARCAGAVQPPRRIGQARLPAQRRGQGRDPAARQAARRAAAGHRTGGGARARDAAAHAAVAHGPALQAARRGRRASGPPGDAARRFRLVVGAAFRGREGGAGAAVGVRGRLHVGSG